MSSLTGAARTHEHAGQTPGYGPLFGPGDKLRADPLASHRRRNDQATDLCPRVGRQMKGDANIDPADDVTSIAGDKDNVLGMAVQKFDALFQRGGSCRIPQFVCKTGCGWRVIRRDFSDSDQYVQDSARNGLAYLRAAPFRGELHPIRIMITIRKSEDRGHANHGWLDSHHTFSFADYFDPKNTQFHSLRVLNEDRVTGGQGFGSHPHRDMEIISYVVEGALEHTDSLGTKAVMRAGDVQRISAGSGVIHSEYNASKDEPVHFLQIWIVPDERAVTPEYAEKSFRDATAGKLHLIASKAGRNGSLTIHQDADLNVARLKKGEGLEYGFADKRAGWVQLIEGELTVNGTKLKAGDGAAISGESQVRLEAAADSHFLFFDLQ